MFLNSGVDRAAKHDIAAKDQRISFKGLGSETDVQRNRNLIGDDGRMIFLTKQEGRQK